MSTKIITLDGRFYTGEPTVQLVATLGRNGRTLRESTSLHKTASHSPAMDYIRAVQPEPGKSIVLVIGLGDNETYGANRNGDGFPSEPVPGKIAADEVLTKHFQSYDNAHVFKNHVNHDPAKAIGRVKKAFWNPYMRRVEVLEDFEHDKAPELLEQVTSGEYPAKSMGCKIPYDVCTKCGNRAKTRADYCDHLRYEMGRIYDDGTKAAALNPSPRFFDSSWVVRPADRTGFMLKKVAKDTIYDIRTPSYELGEKVAVLQDKAAALAKAADMEKIVSGTPEASSTGTPNGTLTLMKRYADQIAPGEAANMPGLDSKALKITVEYTPDAAVGTSDALGLPMGLKELIQYFMGRMAPDADCAPPTEPELEAASKHAGAILELFAEYPRFYDDVLKTAGLSGDLASNEELAQKLGFSMDAPAVGDTDLSSSPRYPSATWRRQRPNTDTLSYTDASGQKMTTNLGLARRTTDALTTDAQGGKLMRGAGYLGLGTALGVGGMGALMTGARKPLRRFGGGLALAGAAAVGLKGLHEAARPVRMDDLRSPMIMTNEGEVIPAYTEFSREKMSAWRPEMLYPVLRLRDGACTNLGEQRKLAFRESVRSAEVHDDLSPVLGPTLNLEKVALILEQSISELAQEANA
jgi:hypothetical protein